MIRVHRADDNQAEIVAILREVGVTVQILSQVGGGCPDLLVGWRGVNYLLEVKSARGKLSLAEAKFARAWAGQSAIVRSPEDALKIIGLMEDDHA